MKSTRSATSYPPSRKPKPTRGARHLPTPPIDAHDAPRVVSRSVVGHRVRSRRRRQGRASHPARRGVLVASDPVRLFQTRCPPAFARISRVRSRDDRLGERFRRDGRFRFRFRFRASPASRIAVVGGARGPDHRARASAPRLRRRHGVRQVPRDRLRRASTSTAAPGADKLGCLEMFREHNNPMCPRTRRVGNDALGQLELMNINIPDLIDGDDARTGLVSPTDGDALCGTVMRCDCCARWEGGAWNR